MATKYDTQPEYWKRKQDFEEYKQKIITRTSCLSNAISVLGMIGVEVTFENILLYAHRLQAYIETGDLKTEKLDSFINNLKNQQK
jgi:hypothetical protein